MLKNNNEFLKQKHKYLDCKLKNLKNWKLTYDFYVSKEDYEEVKDKIKYFKHINGYDLRHLLYMDLNNLTKKDLEVYGKNYKYIKFIFENEETAKKLIPNDNCEYNKCNL